MVHSETYILLFLFSLQKTVKFIIGYKANNDIYKTANNIYLYYIRVYDIGINILQCVRVDCVCRQFRCCFHSFVMNTSMVRHSRLSKHL